MKSILSLLVLTILSISQCYSQSNHYLHFSVPEGLPSSEVYDVYQDKKGFIWFATDNGVVRYDGRNMELFQSSEGLSDPVVFEFVEDAKERLWFRTFSGKLSYFFNERIHQYAFNDSLSRICKGSFLESIYIDSQERVWFGSTFYLGSISAKGVVNKSPTDTSGLVLKNVEKGIICANWGPASKINHVRINTVNYELPVSEKRIQPKISVIQWKGNQYFAIGDCIYKINEKSMELVFTGIDQIIALSVDYSDNLWIGYWRNGTACYQNFNSKRIIHFDFVNTKAVTKVFQDRDGGYWISTLQDGVYYVPDIDLLNQNLSIHSKVNSACSWGKETVIADDKGLLLVLDQNRNVIQQKKLDYAVMTLLAESDERLWVSTTSKTFIFDRALHLVNTIESSLSSLSKDPKGNIRGVNGPKILVADKQGNKISHDYAGSVKRTISCTKDLVFLSERVGLQAFTYSGSKVNLPEPLQSIKTTKVLMLNDSLIIIGTLGSGFFILNQNHMTVEQYFTKQNFTANNIYSILLVDSNLWLGTEKGLAVTSVNSLLTDNPLFSLLFQEKGRNRDKIIQLTYNQDNVWAFKENSFYAIPLSFRKNNLPLFYFQSLLVNDSTVHLTDDLKLNYAENNLQVNFRFIDFRNQDIVVRSRLSDQDRWSYSPLRSIAFHSLQPGSYHLEIEFSIDNIHWQKAMAWNFTILPPWWRTWYVEVSVILIVLLWGITYFRRREARIKERNNYLNLINMQQQRLIRAELDTLERERNRIAKDLHDSVGTNLSAIKMTVWSILKKYDAPKAKAIEGDFQNTIRDIKGIIHDLVPAGLDKYGLVETIRGYAAKMEESLDIKIEVNSFGPDIQDPRLNLLSFRILQELLANSLKHANASKVVIHVNSFEDLLSLLYQDNGRGFDYESVQKGSGLFNIESRVQTAHGTLKFESGNFGVSYIIDIPLNQNGNDTNHFGT